MCKWNKSSDKFSQIKLKLICSSQVEVKLQVELRSGVFPTELRHILRKCWSWVNHYRLKERSTESNCFCAKTGENRFYRSRVNFGGSLSRNEEKVIGWSKGMKHPLFKCVTDRTIDAVFLWYLTCFKYERLTVELVKSALKILFF